MTKLDRDAIRAHLDQLTKPPGSLGRLEDLAADLCRIQGTLTPRTRPRRIVLFAGDHGVVAQGVSAWPSEVTGLMVANIRAGGAASNALARAGETDLVLVDVGCQGQRLGEGSAFRVARVAEGTADLSQGPAMDRAQFDAALAVGREEARRASEEGFALLAAGEMGIGNTTPSTCVVALCLGLDPVEEGLVGPGAGADEATRSHKERLIAAAVERVRGDFEGGDEQARIGALAAVAGFELVAMAGLFIEGASRGMTLVLDGLIAGAGALIAEELAPGTARNLIAAHRSCEPAHGALLDRLELSPYLEWNLRLGEGSGALLLMPLLDAAAAMVGEMATFADLGITAE